MSPSSWRKKETTTAPSTQKTRGGSLGTKKKEDNSQRPQHSENMWEVKTELNFYFHFQKKKATTVTHKGSLGRKQPLNI